MKMAYLNKKIILSAIATLFAATLLFCSSAQAAQFNSKMEKDQLTITLDGKVFTQYKFSHDLKKPYFWPLIGPASGKSVTIESHPTQYPHHNSMWFGCDQVNGGNYWQDVNSRGQILSQGPKVVAEGERFILTDTCDWKQPDKDPIIQDKRRVIFSAPSKDLRIIDFEITLIPLTDITIGKTNHSLFSLRMMPELSVEQGGTILGSEGQKNAAGTFGIESPWLDYSGTRDGITEGAAIFQNPANRWYPSKWFTRDYGFMSPTPMYWPENGTTKIAKGENLTLKYRVVVHAGDAQKADIAGLFKEYTKEVTKLDPALVMKELNALIPDIAKWEYGTTRVSLVTAEDLIRSAGMDPQLRPIVGARLAAVLSSDATYAGKQFICRQLARDGGPESIPALTKLLNGSDAKLAAIACFALEYIHQPEAEAVLLAAMDKAPQALKISIIEALARKKSAKAVAPIAQLLTPTTEDDLLMVAISALGRIATPEVGDALKNASETLPEKYTIPLADAALDFADASLAAGDTETAKEVYAIVFASKNPSAQAGALRGLVTTSPEKTDSILAAALLSNAISVRSVALNLVRDLPGKAITIAAAQALKTLPAETQPTLLTALEARGDKEAAPAVLAAAKSADATVSLAAIQALGTVGNENALPFLIDTLSTDKEKTAAAATALARINVEGASKTIAAKIQGAPDAVRLTLTSILGNRGDTSSAPALVALADDADKAVSAAALNGLEKLASAKELSALTKMLSKDLGDAKDRRPYEASIVIIAKRVAVNPTDNFLAALARTTANTPARASIMRILGRLGDDMAIKALVAGATEKDAVVQDAAIRALAEWPTATPADTLLSIAKETPEMTLHVLAMRGYARMLSQTDKPNAEMKVLYAAAKEIARRPDEKVLFEFNPNGASVSDLKVNAPGKYAIEEGGMKQGALWATDREYTFTAVPTILNGCTYIKVAMDDRTLSSKDFMTFKIADPALVFVAFDERCSALPTWLAGWEKTGMALTTSSGGLKLNLYSKPFAAGSVILGGGNAPGVASMYSVIVK